MKIRIRNFDISHASRNRGIATLITLIALVIMIIAVLALVRSSDTTSVIAGNIAFRRDLTNEAQRVIPVVNTLFATGALSGGPSAAARQSSLQSANYYPSTLPPSNNQGIPTALLNDSLFASTYGTTTNDLTDTKANVTIRYIIDRLCLAGTTTPTAATCVQGYAATATGGTANIPQAGGIFIPAYRVSIRITGPRNTQAFLQATLQLN